MASSQPPLVRLRDRDITEEDIERYTWREFAHDVLVIGACGTALLIGLYVAARILRLFLIGP